MRHWMVLIFYTCSGSNQVSSKDWAFCPASSPKFLFGNDWSFWLKVSIQVARLFASFSKPWRCALATRRSGMISRGNLEICRRWRKKCPSENLTKGSLKAQTLANNFVCFYFSTQLFADQNYIIYILHQFSIYQSVYWDASLYVCIKCSLTMAGLHGVHQGTIWSAWKSHIGRAQCSWRRCWRRLFAAVSSPAPGRPQSSFQICSIWRAAPAMSC